jgi:hypothetical protein
MKSYINPIEKPINIITSLAHDGIKKNWPCANLAMSIMSNDSWNFCQHFGVSIDARTPIAGWFIYIEKHVRKDDLGVPPF